ncbi:cytidylate kinase-like family protein [Olsenella sp. An290]|uniref:cytidylate kinase-like family protein n=1 Tax=Olsenella sp. An290 TaxID=1965625 RepID=UPI001952299E|nr:cytidylate kinase-like family protein [Olsenella sp. An290]
MNRIVTISREFGSGGREVGRRLAEAMGVAYYDQEIVAALMRRSKVAEEYVRYMEEQRPLPLLPITTARTFGLPTNRAVTENLNFYLQESRVIQEVAEASDCVIVGRCADYVLRDLSPVRLFVYADMEHKIARCQEKGDDAEGLTVPELRRKIVSVDKRRAVLPVLHQPAPGEEGALRPVRQHVAPRPGQGPHSQPGGAGRAVCRGWRLLANGDSSSRSA